MRVANGGARAEERWGISRSACYHYATSAPLEFQSEARVATMVLHGPPAAPPSGLRFSGNALS